MRIAYWRSESVRVLRQCAANCKKSLRNTNWQLKTLQYCCALPNGARGIVASINWRSAGIPILNSSADFLNPLCRVLPIRQDITYWFCFTGAETEIHKIKDNSKIKRERTSIAAVRGILGTFGTFPTPLLSRYRLPLSPLLRFYRLGINNLTDQGD